MSMFQLACRYNAKQPFRARLIFVRMLLNVDIFFEIFYGTNHVSYLDLGALLFLSFLLFLDDSFFHFLALASFLLTLVPW